MSNLLIKKTNLEVEKVFPKTYIHNITDKSSNKTLALILNSFNMYFLSYTDNVSATRCLVPMVLRKKGLWITYVKYDGNVCTEWYAASDIDDESWGDSSNWRIGNNMLVGDITISSNGNWVINGTETEFKAIGEKGNTPLIRIADNRLQVSYDLGDTYSNVTENPVYTQFRNYNNKIQVSTDLGTTWKDCSEPIAAWFRWADTSGTGNIGRIQISRDNKTWSDLSPTITNNLYIKGYVSTVEDLPTSSAAIGDIYMVGPTYDESDTTHDYPHYRMWVKLSSGWVDNGEYLSNVLISLITGLETGITMSLKAITNTIVEETARAKAAEEAIIYDISANNDGAVFESLQALLNSSNLSTLVPTSVRHGGMTIRFIQGSEQSSDNKYVQYRLMSTAWSAAVGDWQGVNSVVNIGSNNLVEGSGLFNLIGGNNIYFIDAKTLEHSSTKDRISVNIKKGELFVIHAVPIGSTEIGSITPYVRYEGSDTYEALNIFNDEKGYLASNDINSIGLYFRVTVSGKVKVTIDSFSELDRKIKDKEHYPTGYFEIKCAGNIKLYSHKIYNLIDGHKYRLYVPITKWSCSGSETDSRLVINYVVGGQTYSITDVFIRNATAPYYTIQIPNNDFEYLDIQIRGDIGVTVPFCLVDLMKSSPLISICSTPQSMASKSAIFQTDSSFIEDRDIFILKMECENTAVSPTLNVNGTGAKSLYYNGAIASVSNSWKIGDYLCVFFDGTVYQSFSIIEKGYVEKIIGLVYKETLTKSENHPISCSLEQGKSYLIKLSSKTGITFGGTDSELDMICFFMQPYSAANIIYRLTKTQTFSDNEFIYTPPITSNVILNPLRCSESESLDVEIYDYDVYSHTIGVYSKIVEDEANYKLLDKISLNYSNVDNEHPIIDKLISIGGIGNKGTNDDTDNAKANKLRVEWYYPVYGDTTINAYASEGILLCVVQYNRNGELVNNSGYINFAQVNPNGIKLSTNTRYVRISAEYSTEMIAGVTMSLDDYTAGDFGLTIPYYTSLKDSIDLIDLNSNGIISKEWPVLKREHTSNIDKIILTSPIKAGSTFKLSFTTNGTLSSVTWYINNKNGESIISKNGLEITISNLSEDAYSIGVYYNFNNATPIDGSIYARFTISELSTSLSKRIEDVEEGQSTSIVKLNDPVLTKLKLDCLIEKYPTGEYSTSVPQVVLLHFSDIHGSSNNLKRIIDFRDYYKPYITDVICTGDLVYNKVTDGFTYWHNNNADDVLIALGNHEIRAADGQWNYPQADCYRDFFAPFVDGWIKNGAVFPENYDTNWLMYYYKDYDFGDSYTDYTSTKGLRLIVLDTMHNNTAQEEWFNKVLDDARTKHYVVVCANHYCLKDDTHREYINSNFTTPINYTGFGEGEPERFNAVLSWCDKVTAFKEAGGIFACWLCGHWHDDVLCHYVNTSGNHNDKQLFICIGTATAFQFHGNTPRSREETDKSYDLFNVMSIDCHTNKLRVMRVGANYDRLLRKMDCFSYDYINNEIINEN